MEPGKESLDLPPPLVASQWATVLRSMSSGPSVWRNQLHASLGQCCIQSVRLVGVVADETRWKQPDESRGESGAHERHFMRRRALNVNGDGKALAIGDGHDLRALAALRFAHAGPTLLRGREASVDERLVQIQIAFVVQRLRENFEDAPQ